MKYNDNDIALASCYKDYPALEDYLVALEYSEARTEEEKTEGTLAYKKGKKIYNRLSKALEQDKIEMLFDYVCSTGTKSITTVKDGQIMVQFFLDF